MSDVRIYDYDNLPVPRLELRWEKVEHPEWNFVCIYEMVLRCADARLDSPGLLRINLGHTTSRRGSGATPDKFIEQAGIDTPYRDGVHAMLDSAQLRLPAFACYEGKASFIEPSYPTAGN